MTAGTAPLPPVELMRRVGPLAADERAAAAEFDAEGAAVKRFVVAQLPGDWAWGEKRVLDFGCGAGRVLRHFLGEARPAELWGSESDEACVRWLKQHLAPPLRVIHNGESPPLDAPSGHFDLVYALSAFTHVAEEWSAWLVEIHRLLAPDGLLIASFLGPGMLAPLTGERWSDDRIGMNVTRPGASWDGGGPGTFISPWWLRAHWGRAFEILRLEPSGYDGGDPRGSQGFAVLRRRPVEITREALEAPEPGEPRELSAARHTVRQLARELSGLREELALAEQRSRRYASLLDDSERHWRDTAEWWERRADSILESRTWRVRTAVRRLASRLSRRRR